MGKLRVTYSIIAETSPFFQSLIGNLHMINSHNQGEFKYVQMKSHAIFQGEIITKY